MLGLNPSMRFYLCEGPVDMRKGIFTLAELVRKIMGKERESSTHSSYDSNAYSKNSGYDYLRRP